MMTFMELTHVIAGLIFLCLYDLSIGVIWCIAGAAVIAVAAIPISIIWVCGQAIYECYKSRKQQRQPLLEPLTETIV